jgi:hypothetical protein
MPRMKMQRRPLEKVFLSPCGRRLFTRTGHLGANFFGRGFEEGNLSKM